MVCAGRPERRPKSIRQKSDIIGFHLFHDVPSTRGEAVRWLRRARELQNNRE
jgi:hypothetical protein